MEEKPKLALHWQILIGLCLGAVLGICLNEFWTSKRWAALGVNDAKAFLEGTAPNAKAAPGGVADPNAKAAPGGVADPNAKAAPGGVADPNAKAAPGGVADANAKAAPGGAADPKADAASGDAADPNAGAGVAADAVRVAVKLNGLVGDLFVRALKFIGVPVVLFALVGAVAGLGDVRRLGRIGGKTILLFLCSGVLSVVIGVLVADIIRPGEYVSPETRALLLSRAGAAPKPASGEGLNLWTFFRDIVPTNPFASLAQAQMLQVVFLALAIGIGLTLVVREKAEPVIRFFDGMFEAVLVLVRLIMKTAPVAVFALITPIVATLGLEVLHALALYSIAVVVALALVLFGLYPGFLLIFTPRSNKVGYRRFFSAMAPAQLVAFSSSSSAATLPVTLDCVRNRLGVSEGVTGFVCTVGTTINMDGTALYQAVAATFLAQLFGVPLSFADQVGLVLMSATIAIGTPGVPGGGIVLMAIVLDTFHIPAEGIAIILAVDRLLDMARTVINVSGDGMGAAVVGASEGQLAPPQRET